MHLPKACHTLVLGLKLIRVSRLLSFASYQIQDEFEPWPHRLVVQTNDSGSDVGEYLPASIAALLLQKKTLSSSGLQILEFEGMDSLRVVARKIIRDLGYEPVCCIRACDYTYSRFDS